MSEPGLGFWSDDSQLCVIPLPHLFALAGKVNNGGANNIHPYCQNRSGSAAD